LIEKCQVKSKYNFYESVILWIITILIMLWLFNFISMIFSSRLT